jgi:hypothetical protein
LLAAGILGAWLASDAVRADEMYASPSAESVRSQALDWAAARGVDQQTQDEKLAPLWSEAVASQELLDKLIATFAAVDPETQAFVAACDLGEAVPAPATPALLSDENADKLYRANVGLFYGRYLAQRRMYDESLAILDRIEPREVVEPGTYFFFKAVCQHQLLMAAEALATLDQLQKNTEGVPVSYQTLASLMRYDLEEYKQATLDEVSRKMRDSERRLDLGRGGQRVQKVQDEIIATLDEIIKKAEQQNAGGASDGEGSGQGRSNQANAPAQDSRVKGSTAPGEVDERKLSQQGGWGALPPKEEERAKNLINQNFPNHYREAVEEYFKKLANRRAEP